MIDLNIKIIKEETISIIGPRPNYLPWGYDEVIQSCLNFKKKIKEVFEGAIKLGLKTFLTGLSEGFDMISTEILIELHKIYDIKIIAVIPCLGHKENGLIINKKDIIHSYVNVIMQLFYLTTIIMGV